MLSSRCEGCFLGLFLDVDEGTSPRTKVQLVPSRPLCYTFPGFYGKESKLKTIEAVDRFLLARQTAVSPRTLETYRYNLGRFAKHCPDLPRTPEPLEAFLSSLKGRPATKATYYRHLRLFYHWLQDREVIDASPMTRVAAPRTPRTVARSLTQEELAALLLAEHPPKVRALLWLLADTGLRLSEALSVTATAINGTLLAVHGKTGERLLPVSPKVATMVKEALPWPWRSHWLAGARVKRAFEEVGITGHRVGAHTLRHTFVQLWQGDESVLVDLMGWTSPKMLRVYKPYSVARAQRQHSLYRPTAFLDQPRQERLF